MIKFLNLFTTLFKKLPSNYRLYFCVYTIINIIIDCLSMLLPLLYSKVIDGLYLAKFDNAAILLYCICSIVTATVSKIFSMMNIVIKNQIKQLLTSLVLRKEIDKNKGDSTLLSHNMEELTEVFGDYIFTIPSSILSVLIAMTLITVNSFRVFCIEIIWILCFAVITKYKNKKVIPESQKAQNYYTEINNSLGDDLVGAEDIQINNSKDWVLVRQKNALRKYDRCSRRYYVYSALTNIMTDLMNSVFYILVVFAAFHGFLLHYYTFGIAVVINEYNKKIFQFLSGFAQDVSFVNSFIPHMEKILHSLSDRTDNNVDNYSYDNCKNGDVIIDKVCFKISDEEAGMIDAIISQGDIVAITGDSGSGKSTFLNVMINRKQKESGRIVVNPNIKVAFCEQESFLLNDSIQTNMFIEDDDENKNKRLDEYLIIFGLDKEQLSDKIGDGGKKISGGQRSKLTLIRTLLTDADVYIFDEPLTGVDEKGKKEIFKFLINELSGKTIIFTSHDMNMIRCANKRINIQKI